MTTLAEEGCLADELTHVVAAARKKYAPWLAEIRALNILLVRSQYEMHVHMESAQEVTTAALYIRSLAHTQAAVLLLERGMRASARALMRCALEGLFNLGACAADPKTALAFLDKDETDRKQLAKHLADGSNATAWGTLGEEERQVLAAYAEREIEPHGLPNVRERAKRAGMEALYLTAYSQLNAAVHSNVGDLDEHFHADESGNVSALVVEPVLERLDILFLIVGETMVSLLRECAKVFPLSMIDECEARLTALQALVPKL